jgi:hypothetical protein
VAAPASLPGAAPRGAAGEGRGTSLADHSAVRLPFLRPGPIGSLLVLAAAGAAGAAGGAWAAHATGRLLPLPLLTGACVAAAVAAAVVAAHRALGAPGLGRGGARAVLWGTLLLALAGQVGRDALDYAAFRRAAVASLVAGPGAPSDPDLYLDLVLLAETGQAGFPGYVLASLGIDRSEQPPARLRLRVLGHLVGAGMVAAVAAHAAQRGARAARCAGCARRAERCACGREGVPA